MNRQGSDKGSVHGYANGLFVGHAFTEVYDATFRHQRDSAVRLLEIGIGPHEPGVTQASPLTRGRRGGSAVGWHEYFAHGDIHAMDILDCSSLDRDRLTTHTIVHFEGFQTVKPWFYRSVHPLRGLYRQYRQETPWPMQQLEHKSVSGVVLRPLPVRWQYAITRSKASVAGWRRRG